MANPRQAIDGATRHAVDGATRGIKKPGDTKVPIEEQDHTKPRLEPGKTVSGGDVEAAAELRRKAEVDAEAEAEARRKAELDAEAAAELRRKAELDAAAAAEARRKAELDAAAAKGG